MMKPNAKIAGWLALLFLFFFTTSNAFAEPVTFKASDGTAVYGNVWRAADARAPMIVAFHQAGSSSAEYTPIAPRLAQSGFTVLAIDQRSGNGAFGGKNRTAAARGRASSFEEALPDMEAALVWAKLNAQGAPVIVWGSSYSAALAFVLAAKHPVDVSGVVAFSPGEYFDDKHKVGKAAKKVRVPVFIDQASDAEEIAQSTEILRAVASPNKLQFISKGKSTHGSSTLRADTNAAGAELHWMEVMRFLDQFKH